MSIENFVLSRSIQEVAAFFEVASEVRNHGIEVEQCNGYQKIVGVRGDYTPSIAWKNALWELCCALSNTIAKALDDDFRYQGGSVPAWQEAAMSDIQEDGGWVHRIIMLINHARKVNISSEDLGDPEFYLMKRAIVEKRNELKGSFK